MTVFNRNVWMNEAEKQKKAPKTLYKQNCKSWRGAEWLHSKTMTANPSENCFITNLKGLVTLVGYIL